jgi:hypothetical protein
LQAKNTAKAEKVERFPSKRAPAKAGTFLTVLVLAKNAITIFYSMKI